jgi:vitamin B12 transporter
MSRSMAASALALGALVLPSLPVRSQPVSQLPPTVVTPARQSQSIDDALPATSVITRADIDRWQAVELVSMLSRETGVQFAQSGGRGAAASLFLRGSNSSQVLVLVDGVRLNAGTSGASAIGGIALDTIDRIEIVRGNLSSVYGSSAIGGVVQIFTRRGGEHGLTLSAEGGQGRTVDGRAAAGFDAGAWKLGGALGGGSSQAISSIDVARVVPGPFAPGANPDLDGNRYGTASLGATYRSSGGTLVALNGWANRNTTDFDSTADGPDATHVEKSQLTAVNALVRTPVSERWSTQLALGASRDRSTNSSSDPASFNNGEFSSDNLSATWTNDLPIGESVTAQLGAEYLRQVGESTTYDPSFSGQSQQFVRSVGSGWAGIIGNRGPHQFQANLRQDQYSDVGGATSALGAYGYKIDAAWRVSAQLSNAFRAPSFNDLYFPFFGNPDLEPERSVSGELGLQYAGRQANLRAALFRTDTRDLVVFDPAAQRAENLDEARATGFELGGVWRSGAWQLYANGTLLRAVDESTGERLLRRAPWTVNAGATYDPGSWSAGAEVSVVGPRDDIDINSFQRVELASYTLVRLVAAWRVSTHLTLRARVENLFDAEYETVSGYNTVPRTVIVGADLRY